MSVGQMVFYQKTWSPLIIDIAVKAHLHYGQNRAKLVHFKEQKIYFASLKPANLAQSLSYCKHGLSLRFLAKIDKYHIDNIRLSPGIDISIPNNDFLLLVSYQTCGL